MSHETLATLRAAINQTYLADENLIVGELLAGVGAYNPVIVSDCAKTLVYAVRAKKDQQTPIEAFLHEPNAGHQLFMGSGDRTVLIDQYFLNLRIGHAAAALDDASVERATAHRPVRSDIEFRGQRKTRTISL